MRPVKNKSYSIWICPHTAKCSHRELNGQPCEHTANHKENNVCKGVRCYEFVDAQCHWEEGR